MASLSLAPSNDTVSGGRPLLRHDYFALLLPLRRRSRASLSQRALQIIQHLGCTLARSDANLISSLLIEQAGNFSQTCRYLSL
jgi:hypothetical protein